MSCWVSSPLQEKLWLHNNACLFVGWLLNAPVACKCISGTDLLRQVYMLPHWDRSCRSNFPSHPVTVYWHQANQSLRLAGQPLEGQSLVWLDPLKFQYKWELNPGSATLEADTLTTRPKRWSLHSKDGACYDMKGWDVGLVVCSLWVQVFQSKHAGLGVFLRVAVLVWLKTVLPQLGWDFATSIFLSIFFQVTNAVLGSECMENYWSIVVR